MQIVLLAVSLILLAAAVWILLPPWHAFVLPLSIAAPELSPVLLVASLIVWAAAARAARTRRIARVSVAAAMVTTVHALVPLVQMPLAVRRHEVELKLLGSASQTPTTSAYGIDVTRRVQFSNADGVPLTLDVYRPVASRSFPVLLQIYGGAWRSGTPANDEWFARHFAARGFVVFAMDYRHAPKWKWPEQIVDARTALWWIGEHAAAHGGDPSKIVIVGRSSGAQIAMRLAYQEGPSSIRGVVNLYGPVDLADGWRHPPRPDPLHVRRILEDFIGGTPDMKPEHYRHASPITWVSASSAPTLSLYGSRDHVVEARFGRALHAAMGRAGATSLLVELPWSEHGFDAVPFGVGRGLTLRYVERFIRWAVAR